jgi:fructose-bisphosphate aldolase, class I
MKAMDIQTMAQVLSADGKGILAADETMGTLTKQFEATMVASTSATRRAYREMFFTTPGIAEFISGIIMHDETIRQMNATAVPFTDVLDEQGIVAGIKVDAGPQSFAGSPEELITEGLDGLRGRLKEYHEIGARFAKWRAVIVVTDELPTTACIHANAHALARCAALCQQEGIVPIVEAEVLMDGAHTIERTEEVTGTVLHAVFRALFDQNVLLEGMLLKPNMVLSGKGCATQASVNDVAFATIRCLARYAPAAVPGIVFLSGSQDHLAATQHLSAINQVPGPKPWKLSFSYGRALQEEALRAWRGKSENLKAAQTAFYHRARCVSAAALGRYTPSMESESAVA